MGRLRVRIRGWHSSHMPLVTPAGHSFRHQIFVTCILLSPLDDDLGCSRILREAKAYRKGSRQLLKNVKVRTTRAAALLCLSSAADASGQDVCSAMPAISTTLTMCTGIQRMKKATTTLVTSRVNFALLNSAVWFTRRWRQQ